MTAMFAVGWIVTAVNGTPDVMAGVMALVLAAFSGYAWAARVVILPLSRPKCPDTIREP